MVQYLFYYTIWYLLCNCNRSNIVWWPGQKWLCGKLSTVGQSYKKKHEHILHQLRMDWLFKGHFCSDLPIWARLAKQSLRAHSSWWSNRQKCSSSLFCHHHRSWECYCFVARGIVSVVCSIVLSKGCKPFMWDLMKAAISNRWSNRSQTFRLKILTAFYLKVSFL